uniref:Glutathione S-transferase n=1 Tax=Timema monikensis TaxID=170555 RepID=A0A7R9HIC0_9NEOP|nr:unnamed protein product [Timema monikensis]
MDLNPDLPVIDSPVYCERDVLGQGSTTDLLNVLLDLVAPTMPVYLYSMPWSPPCRAVLLLAENLGVEIIPRLIDTRSKDHLKPDFIKPRHHGLPGGPIREERLLVPQGPQEEGSGQPEALFRHRDPIPQIKTISVAFHGKDPDESQFQQIQEAVGFLEKFLEGQQWVAGDALTIADYNLLVSVADIQLNDKIVDLFKKEHLEPDRAIMGYLVDQYGKNDSLYPKDPKKRALVDQRLYFDIGTIYQRYVDYLRPVLIFGEPEDAEKLKKIEEALAILEVFLEGQQWVAGDNITIADYTLAVTLSGIEETDIKLNNYPNVVKWFARAKTTIEASAPCRSIMLLAKAIGVDLNLKKTVLTNGDHLKPEFLKMNPQHTIPTLDDNGFALWESRAILAYLQSQYGKDESLYPKDPKKRAVVDQRLYFDMGTLYARIGEYYYPIIFQKAQGDPEKFKKLEEAFEFLEKFLTGSAWVAGDKITIADYAVIASVSTAEVVGFHVNTYPNVANAPCRIVLLTAKAVGVDLNLKLTNLFTGEHLKPEYIKLNPQHTVPTLNDNGFILTESRAIAGYLVDQYGKNDSLYPKDPKKRAVVDQRLYFDIGTLYQRFSDYYYPIAFAGAPADAEKLKKLEEAFGFLDKFLEGQEWAAGNKITLADISLIFGYSLSKYPNVNKWFTKCKKSIPGYEELNHSAALSSATWSTSSENSDDPLYPRDPKKRALVDQRLYFDIGTLYQRFGDYCYPVIFNGAEFDPEKLAKLEEAVQFLDKFLEGQQWVAGSNLTIADISIAVTLSSAEVLGYSVNPSKYPNVSRWLIKAKKTIPGYAELNGPGLKDLKGLLDVAPGNKNK